MPDLFPYPRQIQRLAGFLTLPLQGTVRLEVSPEIAPRAQNWVERLQVALREIGMRLSLARPPARARSPVLKVVQSAAAPRQPQGYGLRIDATGITLSFRDIGGLAASVATLRQLLRQYGRRLPTLLIRDYPDFQKRGVMLDISRGRVPNLESLLQLAEMLADLKINELQLYTEHTFAYRKYAPVWREWGPITGREIRHLDAHCRRLGIDLVPNQNSFGHLRYWLEYPPLKKLAEVNAPYEGADGTFLRFPSTLAPINPGALPFLRALYDELLPHFSSKHFNVGCDETWDLGRGQSRSRCEKLGKGVVYVDFLKKIQREVSSRGRTMMFWGDIILHYPQLLRDLPKDMIALNWGYEADHPFEREAGLFARSHLPFYVCPGTSTWMALIGRHDNAFSNLKAAAAAGRKHRALGFLNTDWGDGGHPQPLTVSFFPYASGAALSWCGARKENLDQELMARVLSRDVFGDATLNLARAALQLGLAHRKFAYQSANITPFGCVLTAPRPVDRELFCREGLKLYARIQPKCIRLAMEAVEEQRATLSRARPVHSHGAVCQRELDLAARMALESCHIMLWQQTLAAGKKREAARIAAYGIQRVRQLEEDYAGLWPLRNKGTPKKSSAFFQWRIEEYRQGDLAFPPARAREQPKP